MKTKQQAREAASELIQQGRLMAELTDTQAFQVLINNLNKKLEISKDGILNATDWEDFIKRRAFHEGFQSLLDEVDTIISRGKSKERSLKNK